MALKSYQEHKLELLREMAAGMMSKVPIVFDEDDLAFLHQFPLQMWKQALKWRYNRGLRQSVDQKGTAGKVRDIRNVQLPGTFSAKDVGNLPGKYVFRGIKTNQSSLLKKLSGKPPYAQISGMNREQRKGHGAIPYDYDTSKVYQHEDDNPLHFLEGMPLMQSDVATNSLSAWIKANAHGLFGQSPAEFQGQPVTQQKIKKYQFANQPITMPSVKKQFSNIQFWPNFDAIDEATKERYQRVYKDNKVIDLPTFEDTLPILLPGRYVPYMPQYDNITKKPGGLTSIWLMNNLHRLTDAEKQHFASAHYGPIDHVADDPAVRNGRFYVIGGWTPTAQQKGVHPLFDRNEDLDDWLRENPDGSDKNWQQIIREEAEKGVMQFVAERNTTPEGVIMQLLLDDIIQAATQNLYRNLGSTKYGPFRYDKEGHKQFNFKTNSKNRIRKAYNFAQTVSQTNISFVNGTRRQREKWGAEGKPEGDISIPRGKKALEGGDELLLKSQGARRWVDILHGYTAAQGWIGHSIEHMKKKIGGDLEQEAKREAGQAARAKNIETRIKLRGGAVAHALEALLMKYTALQAAHLSAQGQGEESMTINTDKALASAVSELPAELRKLGIDYTELPKDIVDYFNQRKFKDEDFIGKSAATSNENPGVALINQLINDPQGINLGGKQVTLQDLAKDENLYQKMIGYIGNLKSISGDAKTQRAMQGALGQLLGAVNRLRKALGLDVLAEPSSPKQPLPDREGQFRNLKDQRTLLNWFMHPANKEALKREPQLRVALVNQMNTMIKQGMINATIKQRIEQSLAELGQGQHESAGTGIVFGNKYKKYNHPDSQMWGVPGGLGVRSPKKGPIKNKKSKK